MLDLMNKSTTNKPNENINTVSSESWIDRNISANVNNKTVVDLSVSTICNNGTHILSEKIAEHENASVILMDDCNTNVNSTETVSKKKRRHEKSKGASSFYEFNSRFNWLIFCSYSHISGF